MRRRPALAVQPPHPLHPVGRELVADMVVEEILALDAARLGEAQQLALGRDQAAVQGVELIDELLDAARC